MTTLAELKQRKYELENEKLEAEIEVISRESRLDETSDWHNGVFYLTAEITPEVVVPLMQEISEFRRYAPRRPVTLNLDSPGGLNTSGMHLFSFLDDIPKLTVHVRGWAASMATVVLQAGKIRRMDHEAHLMVHKSHVQLGQISTDDLMLEAEVTAAWSKQVFGILASKSDWTVERLDAETKHRDLYLTAPEAWATGLVDELV